MARSLWLAALALVLSAPPAAALALDTPAGTIAVDAPALEANGARIPAAPALDPFAIVDAPAPTVDAAAEAIASAIPRAPETILVVPPAALPAAAPEPSWEELPPAATAAAATAGLFGALHLLAALYSRFAPSELLDHERREKVIALVRATPGIGPTDIGAALGTSWGVTIYHLDRLEKAGLVTSQRVGHHRCYFLPGAVPKNDQAKVAMFRVETTRRVAALVREKPGLTQTEIANALGLSASAMSKQVSRLEAAGMLRRESVGSATGIFPQPELAAVLA